MRKKRIFKKTVLYMLATMVAIVFVTVMGRGTVDASTATHTQDEAVAWAKSQQGKSNNGNYGAQCVDLIRAYYNYLGQAPVSGHAYSYRNSGNWPSGWQGIVNTPSFVPQPGDIAVWNPAPWNGNYGHVAIVLGGCDTNYFQSIDQNWYNANDSVGSPGAFVKHDYHDIWGFIRPQWPSKDTESPKISNVKITNVSGLGYTVTCTVTDNVGIDRVQFPTWTAKNGGDDMMANWDKNPEASGSINGNKVSYRVRTSAHSGEVGQYYTHIYAFDKAGNSTSCEAPGVYLKNVLTPVSIKTYNNHLYAYFAEPGTWSWGDEISTKMGGHLVTITSQEEEKIVTELLGGNSAWIGLRDVNGNKNWTWVTGENFSYSHWRSGEPSYGGEKYACKESDTWNDRKGDSDDTVGFVLEIEPGMKPSAGAAWNTSIYESYDAAMPWELAKVFCEMQGGHLATVTSAEEGRIVGILIDKCAKSEYFLGASDKEKEGTWKWVTGETFSYTNWRSNQPDNSNEEHYLEMCNDKKWSDTKTYAKEHGFILEKKDSVKPEISNVKITDITYEGYTVSCTVTDNAGVDRVQFPTWTSANGQDDIAPSWTTNTACKGTKNGDTYTFRVKRTDHNYETGDYNTHIYAYDAAGNRSSVSNKITVSAYDLSGYTKVTTDYFVAKIKNPHGNNYLTATTANSNNAYASNGDLNNTNKQWIFSKQSDGTYIIANRASNLALDVSTGATKPGTNIGTYEVHGAMNQKWNVLKKGNNIVIQSALHSDRVLHVEGAKTGEGVNVELSYMNSAGGAEFVLEYVETAETEKVAPVISDVLVSDITYDGYTITCKVTDNFGVTSVKFPTWTSANGKDDLDAAWQNNSKYLGTVSGTTYTFRVKVSDHNNESGMYITNIYAYDKAGNYSVIEKSVEVPKREIKPTFDEKDKTMRRVEAGITVKELNVVYANTILIYQNGSKAPAAENARVQTGDVVKLLDKNGAVTNTYTACIKGDVTGDGNIDVMDMEKIQKSILGIQDLTGVYKTAGMLSGVEDLNVIDMEIIQKDILGLERIRED